MGGRRLDYAKANALAKAKSRSFNASVEATDNWSNTDDIVKLSVVTRGDRRRVRSLPDGLLGKIDPDTSRHYVQSFHGQSIRQVGDNEALLLSKEEVLANIAHYRSVLMKTQTKINIYQTEIANLEEKLVPLVEKESRYSNILDKNLEAAHFKFGEKDG